MVVALPLEDAKSKIKDGGIVLQGEAAQCLDTQEQIKLIHDAASIHKLDLDARVAIMHERKSFFEPKFTPRPQTQTSIESVKKRYTILKDGWQWCILCSKWSDPTHDSSTIHLERLTEMATTEEMIGCCTSLRRWSATLGLVGPLTQASFKDCWGVEVASMPQLLRNRLAAGAKILVHVPHLGKKAKKELSLSDIKGIGFFRGQLPGQRQVQPELRRGACGALGRLGGRLRRRAAAHGSA
jgi:hypothetical protein